MAALNQPSDSGALMVKVLIGGSPLHYYTCERRQRTAWDAGIDFNGLVIHEVRPNGLNYLLTRLLPGARYTEPGGRYRFTAWARGDGVRIETLSQTIPCPICTPVIPRDLPGSDLETTLPPGDPPFHPSMPIATNPKGDVTGDGKVDIKDAVTMLKIAVGAIEPTEAQRTAGDLNGDGKLDLADAILMLQRAIGL